MNFKSLIRTIPDFPKSGIRFRDITPLLASGTAFRHEAIGHDYELEYGTNRVEVHVDGIARGERVVVLDDLLATGGTALATVAVVERGRATITECAFVIELVDLPGRRRLEERGLRVHALCTFTEDEG